MKYVFVCIYLICNYFIVSAEFQVPPRPDSYILDQADILDDIFEGELQEKLIQLTKDTSSELAVLTLGDLQGYTIEEGAIETARSWGIGQEGSDNGVLLLIAPKDKSVRIEVGYGLEGVITDAESSSIIHTIMIPYLREGQYNEAVDKATNILDTAIRTEQFPDIPKKRHTGEILYFIFALIFTFGLPLISILTRSKGWIAGGVIGGIIAVFGSLVVSGSIVGIAICIGVVIGLITDFILSRIIGPIPIAKIQRNYGGRSRGSRSRRSSGFGGFGGGGFGGGGASGKW